MSSLNIGQPTPSVTQEAGVELRSPALTARCARRARLLGITVLASVVATVAIAAGLPAMGLGIYLVATLPFAFFS
ncbi:hypothetical protein P3T43_003279 [Paraburkholderia sp. GAS41]|jgi:hypothetical protein|uniref:hypothetical protein n=1 Tax=Paraburkholderia sp. GAS41 TaxID=3035134 RepID=UPI003D2278CA